LLKAAAAKVVHTKAVGSFCVKQACGPEVDWDVPTKHYLIGSSIQGECRMLLDGSVRQETMLPMERLSLRARCPASWFA